MYIYKNSKDFPCL